MDKKFRATLYQQPNFSNTGLILSIPYGLEEVKVDTRSFGTIRSVEVPKGLTLWASHLSGSEPKFRQAKAWKTESDMSIPHGVYQLDLLKSEINGAGFKIVSDIKNEDNNYKLIIKHKDFPTFYFAENAGNEEYNTIPWTIFSQMNNPVELLLYIINKNGNCLVTIPFFISTRYVNDGSRIFSIYKNVRSPFWSGSPPWLEMVVTGNTNVKIKFLRTPEPENDLQPSILC